MKTKPRLAVHKFSSCDGCQLSLLNLGEELLRIAELVDIQHFAEAGPFDEEASVDIALVEGSVSTPDEIRRLNDIRERSGNLVAIGACAVSGGLQALRNIQDGAAWKSAIYAHPEYIDTLDKATPLSEHTSVDHEIWGCPVNGRQVTSALRDLLSGVSPESEREKVCGTCKRQGLACVMVTRGEACLGPVTNDGCGALCPAMGRACYGCYGPAHSTNTQALSAGFVNLGLDAGQRSRRFAQINSHAQAFADAARNQKDG